MAASSLSPASRVPEAARAPAGEGVGELVELVRGGDMRAWSDLYHRHYERIFKRLCFYLGEASVAEDLTQETFARAVVVLPSFDGRAAFSTWLFGIALNVARNFIRERQTQRRAERRLADIEALRVGPDVALVHLQQARKQALYAALTELSEPMREAFVLRELEELSMVEAAARAGVTANTMAVRVFRAREKVREALTRGGWLTAKTEEAG
ncbi:RNA polymerase sigma factor [Nannocystis bainbridge]|uniref:RNA polymerase sigma factor n=1 Tax=Nannocystis bainbridge TaxID=2995303 RepID=A0ABT5DV36_9BACT|nr:RNA polymerase sigma factor [Nannocystis bainbridge]MDC0717507.1 RNA polymerase sigma factor [Nannocystis bainbridge]